MACLPNYDKEFKELNVEASTRKHPVFGSAFGDCHGTGHSPSIPVIPEHVVYNSEHDSTQLLGFSQTSGKAF